MTERVDVDKSWKLLRDDIAVAMEGREGPMETAVPGMVFYRYTKQYPSHTSFLRPRVVVVPQGKKYLRVGDKEYMYGSRLCLVPCAEPGYRRGTHRRPFREDVLRRRRPAFRLRRTGHGNIPGAS